MNPSAWCFGAFFEGRLVAFDAWLPFVGRLKDERKGRRGHRTVCLPDFQGVGIGGALFSHCASMWAGLGYRAFSRTAHPAEIRSRVKSGHWRPTHQGRTSPGSHSVDATRSWNRLGASFEWIGPPMERAKAQRVLDGVAEA